MTGEVITVDKEGCKNYKVTDCVPRIGDMVVDQQKNIYQLSDEEAVRIATKANYLVLIPTIKL